MTAIIANQGLGLFDATRNTLSNSPFNAGALGQSNVGVNFNIANGNVVIWDGDYTRVGQGLDARFSRTYNSQGHIGDADGWRFSFERELIINAGSLTRITGDERRTEFSETSPNIFQSTDGSGAHDTIEFNGSDTYTYTEGSTGQTETYQLVGSRWLLMQSRDASDQGFTLTYDANDRVSRITQTNGEYTQIGYTAANQLESIQTYLWDASASDYVLSGTSVKYFYDTQGRLEKVQTDLTPEDNDTTDLAIYETVYTYKDTTSLLLASITQSDGSQTHFTYDSSDRILTYSIGNGTDGTQQVFTFDYTNEANSQTSVTDSNNQSWTYQYDPEGHLTHVFSPSENGLRQTAEYIYDLDGNMTRSVDGEGRQVEYLYDANGNLIRQIDGEGNRIDRTYSNTNKLLSETLFVTTFDIANINSLTGAELNLDSSNSDELTSHFIYDADDRLRFVVSADKRVVEYQYNQTNGTRSVSDEIHFDDLYDGSAVANLTNLEAWVSALTDKTTRSLVTYQFDFRGQLTQSIVYGSVDVNGAGVEDESITYTSFTYDAFGNLLNEVQHRGVNRDLLYTTAFSYDGMNRLTATTDHLSQTTSISYQGSQVVTTAANGLSTTQIFNSQGLLVTSTRATDDGSVASRDSVFYYDTQGRLIASKDHLGGVSYTLYNEQGQIQYTVDATGAVMEYRYDDSERLINTEHYFNRIDTQGWFALLNANNQSNSSLVMGDLLATDSQRDRLSQTFYDDAGRIDYTIDGEGNYTYFTYDGASRLIRTESREANDANNVRVSRNFYDEDGQLIGALDAEGYVTETKYNGRGLVVESIAYHAQSAEALRAEGSLSELITVTPEKDQHAYLRYDSHNRQVLSIDAEGYVTEIRYLEAGNKIETIEYAKAYSGSLSATNADIIVAVNDSDKRTSSNHYDSLGRLQKSVNYENTETLYVYNQVNQLVQVTVANGVTDDSGASLTRSSRTQYNQMGEVIGEVLDHNHNVLNDTELSDLVSIRGVTHLYDALGRRSETVDAEGNRVFYYYDNVGRLTHTVSGSGEVTEIIYNAFGEIETNRSYASTISTTGLTGGEQSPDFLTNLTAVADAVKDIITNNYYDQLGRVEQSIQANQQTDFTYNSWGDLVSQTLTATDGTAPTSSTVFGYDNRGLLTSTTDSLGKVSRSTYDAFGRVKTFSDELNNTTTYEYDRLGRQILLTDPASGQVHTTYDAFNRTLKTTDKNQNVTQYIYNDSARTTTIVFADSTSSVSTRNIHGEVVRSTDALNATTEFTFNYKGELTQVTDALNNFTQSKFDEAGRLEFFTDKNGVRTKYSYDQSGRVLHQWEDFDGIC